MRRREFITLICGAAVTRPLAVRAQQGIKMPRVVVLAPVDNPVRSETFRAQLHDLGYLEGRNIHLEFRDSGGNFDRLPKLAEELVLGGDVDVIVANSFPAAIAAFRATKTIPIVTLVAGDPVAYGLAKGLAHPGYNVTGVAIFAEETNVKRVELMREAFPSAVKLGTVMTKASRNAQLLGSIQAAAGQLGFSVEVIGIDDATSLSKALSLEVLSEFDALVFPPDAVLSIYQTEIIKLIGSSKKPAIFPSPDWVESGGLMSFGPDFAEAGRHPIMQLDRVLKGEKPSDLPFDRPTNFTFNINLRTARAMGVDLPPSLFARANRVIE